MSPDDYRAAAGYRRSSAADEEQVLEAPELIDAGDDAIEKAAPKGATQTLGSNGVFELGGYVFSYEDKTPLYNGDKRFIIFDQMVRNTAIVGAGVRLFINLITKAEWTVNPPEDQADNPRAQKIAEQAYDMLFDMTTPWATIVRKTAMFRFQGFSVQEWTAKQRDDGAIGILDVENRPQRTITRWSSDNSGTITSCFQRQPKGQEVELPRGKIVYAVDDSLTESPEGVGLYRHLAPIADRMRIFEQIEEAGFETDLRGIPVARAPLGELREQVNNGVIDEGKRTAQLQPLKDFTIKHIRNKKTGLLLPSDTFYSTGENPTPSSVYKWAVDLLKGDSSSLEEMAAAIKRMAQDMAMIMGVEHLLVGAEGKGSLALAQVKTSTFFLILTATLGDLVEVFERDLIEPLAQMNGWPEELIPTLGVAAVSDEDVVEITQALMNLASAGAPVTPSDPAVGEVYDLIGLSRPDIDGDALEADATLRTNRNQPGGTAANQSVPDSADQQAQQVTKNAKTFIRSRRAVQRAARAKMRKAA